MVNELEKMDPSARKKFFRKDKKDVNDQAD